MTDQFIEAGFIPIKPTDPDPFIEAGFIPIQPTQPTQPASPYAERTARAVAKKPEVPGTFLGDIGLAAKAIGTGVYSAAFDVFPKIMAEAIRGGDITVNDANTTLDRWIKEQKKDLERWDMPEHEKNRKLFGILKAQDLQSGLQNLGYSAAIGVAGMIPGAKIGAAIGGALGSPTGPGAAATAGIGAIIGGAIGAAATTAPVAYRATKDQFLADMLDRALALNPGLTEEEWKGMREALEKDAQAYAFWEAAPETVGNMLSAALIKTPVGTYIKRIPNIKNAIGRVLAKAGVKIGLDIPVEVGTETITGIKQATIETKVGLREEDPTAAETFWEVLPPTLVTTIAGMGMGSAADSVSSIRQERSFYNRLQKAGYAKDTIKQIVRKIGFDDSAVYLAETHQDILKQALQADVPPSVMGDMRDSLTPGLVLNTYNQASENGKNESAGIRAVEELTGSKQYRFLQAQLRDAMLTKREQPAAEPAAEPEPTPAVEPETAPAVETVVEPAIEPTPTPEPRLVNVPAIQVADEDIALRPKLMQFKEIEEPLTGTTAQHKETIGGEWDDIKAGTLLLWEPINPKEHDLAPGQKYIVADGHGRVNWARKQEVKPQGFNAQILREADGFTAVEARIMAAVKNIADGKGTIYDQVKVLRNIAGTRGKTEADVFANREGIRGRNAAIIAFDSGNSLHDAFINEQVKPETAALIAKTAPDNDALQRLGLRFALDRQKDAVIEASMNAAQKASEAGRIPTAKQTDMFADTSLDEEWKRQGKIIAAEKTKLKERLLGRKAILKRYEETTATGSVLADKKRVADEVAKIESELARWEEWQLHDDLSAIVNPKEITDIVKTEVKPTPVPAPTPPPTPTPTPAAKPVARTAELTPRQYEERIAKIETEIMKRGKPLELLAIQNEASNRGLSDQEYLSLLEKWWNKQQKPEQPPAPAPETKTSSTQPEQITPPPPSTITQTREAEQAISETEARVGAPSPQVEQLINDNLQRASDMSRRFNIPNLTDEDKFSIARAALVEAANNFDPSKGRFDLWASNAIRNALIDAYRKQIKESDVISLQGEISGQSEKTLQDIIPDWNEKTPEAQAQERDLLDNMHAVISGLDANDMEVVGAIQNNEPLRTLAEKRGISITEMFRQKQAALERVRTALEAKGIDRQAINKLFTQRSPQISMSQANTSATPVTPTVKVEQAQRRIDNWISKQANMPGVIVVQKVEDAAQFGLSESSMSLLRNSNPRGFFWESGNQVVVIADGLRSVDDALEVVLHEAIGHYGVGQVLGKDFDSAMLKLSNEISDADLMKVAADYYNALPDQGLDNPLDSEANRIYLASEYVAINAQNQPTLWQKFVELVRKALGKIMPTTYVNALVKRGGVESIVQASRNYVRGSEYGGIENYLSRMEQPDIRMSVAQPSLFGEEKGKSSLRLDLEAIAALPVGTVQAGVGRQAQAERSLLQFESINKAKELLTRLDKNEIAESEAGQQWADHMSESMKQQARIARREARAGEALGKRQAELFGEPQAQETLRLSVSPPRANPVTDEPTRSLYREMERDYKPGHVGKTEMQARAQSQIDNELQHKNMATLLAETSVKGFTTEPEATLRAQILLNTPEFARLFNGTPDQIDTAISLVTQTLNQGTRTARSMAYRVDQMETPMQRQVMILKLLASPPSKVFKNWHSMTPEAQKAHLDQHRARMKRAIAFLKTKGIHDITKVPEAILSDDQKLAEVINAISQQFASTGDKVYEYWRNSILSGLHTNVVNVTSNFGMSTWEMFVQRPAEALLNMFVKNPMAPTFASLAAAYKQIFPNIHNANLALIKSFQTETGMYSAIDTKGETAIAGKKGRVIRAPQRALLSIDEWFKTILVKSLSYDYATRIADKNKLTGIGRAAYIEWAANDTTGESVVPEEAINEAERILFQTKPGAVGRAILSARNEKGMVGWAFKYLFPFVTTPTNLIKIGIKKSPFGLLNVGLEGIAALRGKDSRYAGDYGKAALITDVVEQAFAWSLAGLLYSWTAPGGDDDEDYLPRITGTVAGTPNERRFKMRNIPAHSIRIGDRWYSYARAEPLSNVLTLTVDALTSLHDVRAGKGLDANDAKKFLSLIKDKTYLQTLGDLMRGIENPEDWTNLAQNFSSSWMPNLFKQAMRATDPMQRDYRVREKGLAFLGKSFIARGLQKAVPLPIESMQPIARIDHWGRPVSKDVQFFGLPQSDIVWRLVVPSTVQNITNMTNIDRMIFNWNRAQTDDAKQWWPGNVRPKIKIRGHEWEMNDDQFEQYQIMRGQMALDIAQRIKWNFNNPTAHHMKVLEKIFERSGRVARLKVLRDILEENRFDRINKG